MGGETIYPPSFTSEEESLVDQDFSLARDNLRINIEDGKKESGELLYEVSDQLSPKLCSSSLELEADEKRRQNVYEEVLQSYCQLQLRSVSLNEAKNKILSYLPGAWIENVGGMKLSDYDVPETTTLLLIGPKGCGKSSLVNRISRVFEEDKFASERAQVSYNSSIGEGTCYLQEYTIPRGSASISLFDTRSLDADTSENDNMIKRWMKKGVRHGELVVRKSDDSSLRRRKKCKTRGIGCLSCKTRTVNFVIFVVDGVNILKSMESDDLAKSQYMQMVATAFKCPYLSFKDDKPVVVITHGDLLSLSDRVRVRVHLGELLGIPPAKQIFDIPETHDPVTELTIVAMLRYSLEHADRNIPPKNWVMEKAPKILPSAFIYTLAMLGIALLVAFVFHTNKKVARKPELRIDWHAIRHIWWE